MSADLKKSRGFSHAAAVRAGEQRYTRLTPPILAIFAIPSPPPANPQIDPKLQAAQYADHLAVIDIQAKAFEQQGPSVHIVRIPNANHYVFQSNEAEVLQAIDTFTATLPPSSQPK
jgi:pimeloyl-ACP methyl ester carboxylesterase